MFTVVVGNPPFGDEVREGDRDRLGDGSLTDFDLSRGHTQISSELVVVERALQFLVPSGRFGMVMPDGALNNSGEGSRCPTFRRFVLKRAKIEIVVSLPDFAFRKAGAQNKTSLLFLQKFSPAEQRAFDAAFRESLERQNAGNNPSPDQEKNAIRGALEANPYSVFLAEVDDIGYTPTGAPSPRNQLYTLRPDGRLAHDDLATVLGQYARYRVNPGRYEATLRPSCHAVNIIDIIDAHSSLRLDPKFHLFQIERMVVPPPHMREHRLGDLLLRREDEIEPNDYPDQEFRTLTLSQDGTLSPREAGKGNNPPSWHGVYFSKGSRWYRANAGDIIISQIDLWKGCVAVIPPEYDQAIVTQEFPLYRVDTNQLDPQYLALLLRSRYFQRAIRAITTGHSNRRRTQREDFEDLRVFLPELPIQRAIAAVVEERRRRVGETHQEFLNLLGKVEQVILGEIDPTQVAAPRSPG